jgi:ADP-ribose pyrophosphatase
MERTLKSKTIYKGSIVNLRVDAVELPGGRKTRREVVEHGGSVAIVAIDSEDRVLLVRQFRSPVGRMLLEIPAGTIEPGEEPIECALRELEEETGYVAREWQHLGGFYSSPGFCTEYLHLFSATELRPGRPVAEAIELVPTPLSQTPELISSGEICDAKSIAGLLWVLSAQAEIAEVKGE